MKVVHATFGLWLLAASSVALAQSEDETCEMSGSWGEIEGRSPTVMLVRQGQEDFDKNDSVVVAFFNDDWSITRGQELGRIKVENESGGWFDNEAVALEHGFIIFSEFKHIENVFGGAPRGMILTRAGKTLDRLDQTGLLTDWIRFQRCRDKKVAAKAERERKEKLAREIPKDPFSN